MYGCGIGPVSGKKNRRNAGRVIDRCADIITLRDPQSAEELVSMGVQKPDQRLTADPALLLHPAEDARVDSFMLSHNLDPQGKYALFVLRPWAGFDAVCPAFAEAGEYLRANYGLQLVFLALEPRRDLAASEQAAAFVQGTYHVLSAPHDGDLIVGLMKRMQVVTSMRLHALIFAAGQGIPLVGVVYDPKVSGFLDYLDQDRYLDLEKVTAEGLISLIEDALKQGTDAYSAKKLRALAEENEQAAAELLKRGC